MTGWRVTRWTGTWLIPDFTAVAEDYDAVHLSIAGYLATAGRVLPVGDSCTVLAGWDPDQTYWLTDTLTVAGPATIWTQTGEGPPGTTVPVCDLIMVHAGDARSCVW